MFILFVIIRLVLSSTAFVSVPVGTTFIFVNTDVASINVVKRFKDSYKVLLDFPVTIGLNGVSKSKSGDKKTPSGIYYLEKFYTRAELNYKYYGVGAWKLNYPNPVDIKLGKTGSGIWIHGVSSEKRLSYKNFSNGCIELANLDFIKLTGIVKQGTPVIIAQSYKKISTKEHDEYLIRFLDKKKSYIFEKKKLGVVYKFW